LLRRAKSGLWIATTDKHLKEGNEQCCMLMSFLLFRYKEMHVFVSEEEVKEHKN